jgi:predicted acylesterase/phospholipase RssA
MKNKLQKLSTAKNDKNNTNVQRALVLQGGGSLGGYEAGVVSVLFHWIRKDIEDKNNENIFDIIAGTSIGAINASILVSHVIKNKSWDESSKQVLKFWKYLHSNSSLNELLTQYGTLYWEGVRMLFPFIKLPSKEAFRRYVYTGVSNAIGQSNVFSPRFFSPIPTKIHNKFYDFFPLSGWWYQYDKEPLKRSVKEFANFPISTSSDNIYKKNERVEPRLLLVSVDIDEGSTVTFDSYPYLGKECQICNSVKNSIFDNKNNISSNKENNKFKNTKDLIEHIDKFHRQNYKYRNIKNGSDIHWYVYNDASKNIFYEGIGPEHVIASASIPINYDNEIIDGHKFWDGGILSNTPLRELISHHITWWSDKLELEYGDRFNRSFDNWNKFKENMKIPDLKLYIINLHPSKEGIDNNDISIEDNDYDMIRDRENDIRFHDKTEYDQKVATMVTDYMNCIDKIGGLAIKAIKETNNSKELEEQFNKILEEKGLSTNRKGERRRYQDLIKNRFNLEVEFKIERRDDNDTISNKVFDFSSNTISRLINEGIHDTLTQLVTKHKESSLDNTREQLEKFINDIKEPNTEEEKYMIDFANKLLQSL